MGADSLLSGTVARSPEGTFLSREASAPLAKLILNEKTASLTLIRDAVVSC